MKIIYICHFMCTIVISLDYVTISKKLYRGLPANIGIYYYNLL